jgi:hypothetical protein
MAAASDVGPVGQRRQRGRAAAGVARRALACLPVVGRATAVAAESDVGVVGRRRQRWRAAAGVAGCAPAFCPVMGRAAPVAALSRRYLREALRVATCRVCRPPDRISDQLCRQCSLRCGDDPTGRGGSALSAAGRGPRAASGRSGGAASVGGRRRRA